MQCLSVMLLATTATALVLPATPRMGMSVRARPVMQFDDEGGMIKEIEEGGMTLEQVKASYGASGPELPADKTLWLSPRSSAFTSASSAPGCGR